MPPRSPDRPSRYSRFVRTMRIALPLTAAATIAVVALWPQLRGIDASFILPDVREVELEVDGRVRLDNPEYVGRGSAGDAYRVEAGAARVDPLAPGRVELEHMRVDLPGGGQGRDLEVHSLGALYDRDAATLDLDGNIRVRTSDGYELRTEAARVEVARGTVVTSTPVDGEGPRGSIVADRMHIEERGEIVRFEGRVRARLLTGDEG
ncbi:MAG: LPS export ABC transporter periplasmic protein LptC [Pseudomonadota bacterium]